MIKRKWRQFILTWIVVFWVAPSFMIHNFFVCTTLSPGSPQPSLPLFKPFGAVFFLGEIFQQLTRGDFTDSLFIALFYLVPFLIYTFILSIIIYIAFKTIRSLVLRRKAE
jgi:hypothetical protein